MNKELEYFMGLPYKVEIKKNNSDVMESYVGSIKELPGCVANAETVEEVMKIMNTVKRLYFSNLIERGEETIPRGYESQRSV